MTRRKATQEKWNHCGCSAEKLSHICILLDILLIFLPSTFNIKQSFSWSCVRTSHFSKLLSVHHERKIKNVKRWPLEEVQEVFIFFFLNGFDPPAGGIYVHEVCVCMKCVCVCVTYSYYVHQYSFVYWLMLSHFKFLWIPHIHPTHITVSITASKIPKTKLDKPN